MEGQSRAQQFSTLCHEVAHALLHPVGDPHGALGPLRDEQQAAVAQRKRFPSSEP